MRNVVVLFVVALLGGAVYGIFRGTMNLFQWFPIYAYGPGSRHLWWETRDDSDHRPLFCMVDKRLTADPFFIGRGVSVSVSHYSFTVGLGKEVAQPDWYRDIDVAVETIREDWNGTQEEEPIPQD